MMTAGYMNLFVLVTSLGPLSSVLPSHRVPFLPNVLDLCIPGKRQSGRSPLEQLHRISSMSYTYQQQTTELVKVENVKLYKLTSVGNRCHQRQLVVFLVIPPNCLKKDYIHKTIEESKNCQQLSPT